MNRRVDCHRFTIVTPPGAAEKTVQARDSIVAWATKTSNQVELVSDVPTVVEVPLGEGWSFEIALRYRTATDDGDGHDLKRGINNVMMRLFTLDEDYSLIQTAVPA